MRSPLLCLGSIAVALVAATTGAAAQPVLTDPAPPPPPIVVERAFTPPATTEPRTTEPRQPVRPTAPITASLRAQAKAKSELGRRHYELGEYRFAISAYREAYLILPSPGVLFNLGQAYRLAGDCVAAASAYRSFLRSEPGGPARLLANEQLATVDACAVQASSREAAQDRRDRTLRRTGLAVAGAGAIGLAVATYFALDARDAAQTVEDHFARGGRWDDIAATDARGHRAGNLALGFGIGGGLAVAAGALVYVLHRDDEPRERDLRLWVSPGASSTTAGVSCRF